MRYARLLFLALFPLGLDAQDAEATAELYQLTVQDVVQVTVFGEDDVASQRRLDARGAIDLPLIGPVRVSSLTIQEAEAVIRKRYIEAEIYLDPQVSVTVVDYAPKEVSILGQIAQPGKQALPPDRRRISIVDLVSAAGGFTRIARSDAVRITRPSPTGNEQVFTVDVEKLIKGRSSEPPFLVEPGDIVYVPERVF